MAQLEFSLLSVSEPIFAAIREFQEQSGIQVHVTTMSWDTAWAELVRMALFGGSPDLSEIGTSWAESLVAMNALRLFSAQEIATLGGAAPFLPALWKSLTSDGRSWAIPYLSDTRVLFYRPSWLAQAGIDPATAFQTAAQFEQTLHQLQANGVVIPLAIPTLRTPAILHNLAPWLWGAGGRFTDRDGKRTSFARPEALAAITAFFRLHRYLAPEAQLLNESAANTLFRQNKAAITISGRWALAGIDQGNADPAVIADFALAPVPGVPFVGGSELVIWKDSRLSREALELARFLTSFEMQSETILLKGPFLPARQDALANQPFNANPHHHHFTQSLLSGRGLHANYMWGLVEDKLTAVLARLWADLFKQPDTDVAELVAGRLQPLAERLDHTLAEKGQLGS
jgi:multiple sugar transport system substrate-binding protein